MAKAADESAVITITGAARNVDNKVRTENGNVFFHGEALIAILSELASLGIADSL